MTSDAILFDLWPRWMESAGAMLRMNARVRTRCAQCGTLMRVELAELVARHGPGHALIDRLEMCRMVGCTGTTFYLAARTYGQEWRPLVRDATILESLDDIVPARIIAG